MDALVVTIDTEEEGRWSGVYEAVGNTCRNIAYLPRIHQIFTDLGVIPTYLVDYPVATDPAACDVLAALAEAGRSEIGAHLHPWCTPPFEGDAKVEHSTYPNRLSPTLQLAKLEQLCDAIERGLGVRPISYRAGRWGFDHSSIGPLEAVGISVDSSVQPLSWWDVKGGGPVFVRTPLGPYHLDPTDVNRPGRSPVVEVPTTTMVSGHWGPLVERLIRVIGPVPGLRRVWQWVGLRSLKPELFGLEDMRALADDVARRRLGVFNIMFHSSVALPGATPYVTSDAELGGFCGRLRGLLEHILSRHAPMPVGLSKVPQHLGNLVLRG